MEEFIILGWKILYHKCLYYEVVGKQFNPLRVSDKQFDTISKRYDKIAKQIKQEPTASIMIGFDMSRPSSVLTLGKVYIDYHHLSKNK